MLPLLLQDGCRWLRATVAVGDWLAVAASTNTSRFQHTTAPDTGRAGGGGAPTGLPTWVPSYRLNLSACAPVGLGRRVGAYRSFPGGGLDAFNPRPWEAPSTCWVG